jgi:myb proto-oncogene protein
MCPNNSKKAMAAVSNNNLIVERKPPLFVIYKVRRKQAWTKFEDKILLMVAKSQSYTNWKTIANQLPNRTATQCYMRYNNIKKSYNKGIWSAEEDEHLRKIVKIYGKSWSILAEHHSTDRTGKQIRDRYVNYLDPKLNRKPFSIREDNKIIELYYQYGRKWAKIAKIIRTRNSEMVKNRFYSVLAKKLHKTI